MKKLIECYEAQILARLEVAGHRAYFVGGCVRDALMGRSRRDIDVTTSAKPCEVERVFPDYPILETGLKHGTITVLMPTEGEGKIPVEITTFRIDGVYSDSRHPDKVEFCMSIEEDLARRDFTINAIACSLRGEIIDPYGGRNDIGLGLIKTVGDAGERFEEDPLRIMRGLRFAAMLGFDIDEATAEAMVRNAHLLNEVSVERVLIEFKKLVVGKFAGDVIRKYVDVFQYVLPEIYAMKGFQQHNSYHKYDVLEHCIRAMEMVETSEDNREYMKIAALLHDVGKPDTYFMDDDGIGHFYGHPTRGAEICRQLMTRLKADKAMSERVVEIIRRHDLIFDKDVVRLKKWLNKLGAERMKEVLAIKLADNLATGNMSRELEEKFNDIKLMIDEIVDEGECFSLKELKVDGRDLIKRGIEPGPKLGAVLRKLLDAVIEGRCENNREALLELSEEILLDLDEEKEA